MQLAALWSARSEHAEPAATRPGAGTSGDIWSRHAIPEMAVGHRLDSTLEQRWTLAQGWLDDVKSRVTRTLLQRHAKLNRWIFSSICSSRVTNAELKEKAKSMPPVPQFYVEPETETRMLQQRKCNMRI